MISPTINLVGLLFYNKFSTLTENLEPMSLSIIELVKLRMKRMSTFIPKNLDLSNPQNTLQGTLFLSSADPKEVSKELIPIIKDNPNRLTKSIIDTWLEERATKDFNSK